MSKKKNWTTYLHGRGRISKYVLRLGVVERRTRVFGRRAWGLDALNGVPPPKKKHPRPPSVLFSECSRARRFSKEPTRKRSFSTPGTCEFLSLLVLLLLLLLPRQQTTRLRRFITYRNRRKTKTYVLTFPGGVTSIFSFVDKFRTGVHGARWKKIPWTNIYMYKCCALLSVEIPNVRRTIFYVIFQSKSCTIEPRKIRFRSV